MSIRFSLRAANGQEHVISGPFRIGRDPECQVRIDNNLISRIHASIWIDDDHLMLRDEGSRNGTQVNGRALAPGEPRYLHHGDQVRVGDTTFVVECDPPPADAAQPAAGFEQPATARVEGGLPAAGAAAADVGQAAAASAPPRRLPGVQLAIGGCLALLLLAACCALGYFATTSGGPAVLTALAPLARPSATPASASAAALAPGPPASAYAARAEASQKPQAPSPSTGQTLRFLKPLRSGRL